ncbi:hypothetical protein LXL04_011547 [Taraxacum kok-saghyz]
MHRFEPLSLPHATRCDPNPTSDPFHESSPSSPPTDAFTVGLFCFLELRRVHSCLISHPDYLPHLDFLISIVLHSCLISHLEFSIVRRLMMFFLISILPSQNRFCLHTTEMVEFHMCLISLKGRHLLHLWATNYGLSSSVLFVAVIFLKWHVSFVVQINVDSEK